MTTLWVALAFGAGALSYRLLTKYVLNWAGEQQERATHVLRGLPHDAFLTFYRAALDEAKRRGVQAGTEDPAKPPNRGGSSEPS